MIAASRRGLEYRATERMTLAQVIDWCTEYDDQHKAAQEEKPKKREMNQAEIDAFLGGF